MYRETYRLNNTRVVIRMSSVFDLYPRAQLYNVDVTGDHIMVASFDIGKRNFAFMVERFSIELLDKLHVCSIVSVVSYSVQCNFLFALHAFFPVRIVVRVFGYL